MQVFDSVSPDGFSFFMDTVFHDEESAKKATKELITARYAAQGYYSTADRSRIPLDEIIDHCRFPAIDLHQDDVDFFEIVKL
jgi:hypothetical protein